MNSSSCQSSQYLQHEYDESYFLARRLEQEKKELRLREEEENRLAVIKLLQQEEIEARQKKRITAQKESQGGIRITRKLGTTAIF